MATSNLLKGGPTTACLAMDIDKGYKRPIISSRNERWERKGSYTPDSSRYLDRSTFRSPVVAS
jgi:hypothetical protein